MEFNMPKKKTIGIVTSDKLDKTISVLVTRLKEHRRYKKYVRGRKKYMVHDENNSARVGDLVRIVEHRPISKTKRFKLDAILVRGVGPEVELAEEAGVEEISRAQREIEAVKEAEESVSETSTEVSQGEVSQSEISSEAVNSESDNQVNAEDEG